MNDARAYRPGAPSRPAYALLVVVAVLAAFAFQGTRGLYASSETRYAECAREMVASGNWLEPTLAGEPHWTKPPLTYWAIAGGMVLLGRSEWAVRLYGAGAALRPGPRWSGEVGLTRSGRTVILTGRLGRLPSRRSGGPVDTNWAHSPVECLVLRVPAGRDSPRASCRNLTSGSPVAQLVERAAVNR